MKTAKDLENVRCPACGCLLTRRDLTDDPEFTYSDYYCIDCEINITIYAYADEEEERHENL